MELTDINEIKRPLVLVAEDDESNFKLIKAVVGKKVELKWARNGEAIVKLYHENKDEAVAILMDIKMPLMDGLQATRIIRAENQQIPIIMQTAYAFASDHRNAMEAGATEVLVKPITLNLLRTCLSRFIPGVKW